jgi:hypothetical protein
MNKSRIQTLPFKPCLLFRSNTFQPKIFRLKTRKNYKPWTFKPCRFIRSDTFRSKIFRLKINKNQNFKPCHSNHVYYYVRTLFSRKYFV